MEWIEYSISKGILPKVVLTRQVKTGKVKNVQSGEE
jgi:hypothetical protein